MSSIKFKRLGISLDCARNGRMNPQMLKKYIDIMSKMGYNTLLLYLEDMLEIEGEPYFGYKRGRFTTAELSDLDAYAKERGVEIVAFIELLSHMERAKRWSKYGYLYDINGVLLCDNDATYEFIEKIFETVRKGLSSNTICIGYDEATLVGRGRHLDLYGYQNPLDIALRHLNRISKIGTKFGYEELISADDTFLKLANNGVYGENVTNIPDCIKEGIPENVSLMSWEYFSTLQKTYDKVFDIAKSITPNVWFCGAMYSWQGYTPHNHFSMQAMKCGFESCFEKGVENAFLTTWGDTGMECSWFSLIPCMYYMAEIAKGNSDLEKIKSGFYEMFGIEWDTFMLLDLPGTANFHYYPDGPSDYHKIANCERHFLYNDCFYGLADNIDKPEYAEEFKAAAERLDKAVVTDEYAYLFEWVRDICNVLAYKCNLGNRTREAYLNKDMQTLKELLPVYDKIIEKMEIFYKSFEKRWMIENLSYGFEVHDIRIGGLIKRVTHCKEMLQRFINGEIDKIEQLDEPVLDMWCRENDNSPVGCLDWKPFFTTSVF